MVQGSLPLKPEGIKRLGVVLKGYPRLSETFIAQEIRELERAGFAVSIISLRHPTDTARHPVHGEIVAPVHYLPEYLYQEPMRVFRAWWKCRKLPGYRKALAAFLSDLPRDTTPNRFRRFGQGLVLAAEYAPQLAFIYAHFIHTPAASARYGAIIAGLDFAISAHAKDIWTTPGWELTQKLSECQWCVTCTQGGLAELQRHAPDPAKLRLVYHGIDLARFPPAPAHSARNGSAKDDPVKIVTVGRAVEKKGLDTLVSALGLLPSDLQWHWLHIGGGPLREKLKKQAETLGIAGSCRFAGSMAQAEVIAAYRDSDLFALPCRIAGSGDRDGLPNVIVEAQSQGLAVVTTPVSGIPELIENGVNGVFVEPDDAKALAAAIERLARDPDLRSAMGKAGETKVLAGFDHRATIGALQALLAGAMAKGRA
jgi:glycosyltransferase involved in cell wall biosynthesis